MNLCKIIFFLSFFICNLAQSAAPFPRPKLEKRSSTKKVDNLSSQIIQNLVKKIPPSVVGFGLGLFFCIGREIINSQVKKKDRPLWNGLGLVAFLCCQGTSVYDLAFYTDAKESKKLAFGKYFCGNILGVSACLATKAFFKK